LTRSWQQRWTQLQLQQDPQLKQRQQQQGRQLAVLLNLVGSWALSAAWWRQLLLRQLRLMLLPGRGRSRWCSSQIRG
jgi:hypothetical protein